MWGRITSKPITTSNVRIIRNNHRSLSTQPGDPGQLEPANSGVNTDIQVPETIEVERYNKNLLEVRSLVAWAARGSEAALVKGETGGAGALAKEAEEKIVNRLSQPTKYQRFLELYNSGQERDSEYDLVLALLKSESSRIDGEYLLKSLVKITSTTDSSTASVVLLSTLSKLLVAGETTVVRDTLLTFLNNSNGQMLASTRNLWRIYYSGESRETVIKSLASDSDQIQGEIVIMLVRLALAGEFPLLAASLLCRMASIPNPTQSAPVTSTLTKSRLNSLVAEVIETITLSSIGYGKITLQVLTQLRRQFPRVSWTRDQTSRVLSLALDIDTSGEVIIPSRSNRILTSLVADYGMAALEPIKVCDVIRANLRVNNDYTAYKQWKLLSSTKVDGNIDIPCSFLSYLIRKWSNHRRYHHEALRIITEFVPVEKYASSGVAEAILHYCAKTKTDDIAVMVIERLSQPMSRANLAALLELQLELDQPEGVKRVVGEIFRQSSHLSESEVTMLVQVALRQSTAQGVALVRRFENERDLTQFEPGSPGHHYIMAYCAILDKSYERKEWDNVITYTAKIEHLITSNEGKINGSYQDRLRLIQLKYANRPAGDSSSSDTVVSARAQQDLYQQWGFTPSSLPTPQKRLIAFRLIGLQAVNENNLQVFEWVLKMMENTGVSRSALKAEWFGMLRERQGANMGADELLSSLQY